MLKRTFVNRAAFLILALLLIANYITPIPWWGFALVPFVWFWITLCGSFLIRWDYHFPSLHANKTIPENKVAITFDDGPNEYCTPKVLKLLAAYDAQATFFCVGQQIEKHPEILKDIIEAGHSVGNHTFTHAKSFGFYSYQRVLNELQKTTRLIKELTGLETKLYRPCFAVTNPTIQKAVSALQLHCIGWNVRSLDTTPRPAPMVLKRITSKISKGDVVLLHDTSDKTVAVLEQLLLFLQEKQLQSVPVDQLLNIQPYA